MTEIHNAELTQEIVIGAVAAWLEQTNDSYLGIDVSFQRDINHNSNQDLMATTKIDILKADDFRPMKRGQHAWCDDDQKMIDEMPKRGSNDVDRDSNEKAKPASSEASSAEKAAKKEGAGNRGEAEKIEKRVAVKWELPSAEYYAVRYEEHIRRNLNVRRSCGELETAHEALAVREKGEANDRTDQDCLTQPRDVKSSKESLISEAPTQRDRSPVREPEPIVKPPVEEKVPEEPKKKEPKPEEPKKEEPKVEEPPKKEEPPKIEEKREEVKKVETPVPIVVEEKPKKRVQINIKRHPDRGELKIESEKNGIVTFSCFTNHIYKSSKKANK